MDENKLLRNVINVAFGKSLETSCILINGVSELVNKDELQTHFNHFGTIVECEIDRLRQRALVSFQQVNYFRNCYYKCIIINTIFNPFKISSR